jgi:4-hydroxy 2-oxovalerate aldolase
MTMLYDVTLRDGNHALKHQLDIKFVRDYCALADKSGVWAIEVGHGNGLGASSFLVGQSRHSDFELLSAARESLTKTKLAVHSIPGFSTIKKDLVPALNLGVDVFRVASHVTEANVSAQHIEFLKNKGVNVQGVLMMSHMASTTELLSQCKLLESYGADAIVLMDSAGYFDPNQIRERMELLREEISVDIGIHAHNNLGVGVANALAAKEMGATFLDGASMALGAGAGNAQLETIVAHLNRLDEGSFDLNQFLLMSDLVGREHKSKLPSITGDSVASGTAGAFSGYAPLVKSLAVEFSLNAYEFWQEIGERNLVAGQESQLREIAMEMRERIAFD